MRLLVENYTEKDIARQLGIAPSTVKTHRQHLYEKLGVKNVLGLFKYFSKREASPQHGESLVGYWISKYDFQQHVPYPTSKAPRFREATQINLEFVEVASGGFFSYQGKNVCGTRSDSSTPHEHALRIRVRNQLVVGIWENSNSAGVPAGLLT